MTVTEIKSFLDYHKIKYSTKGSTDLLLDDFSSIYSLRDNSISWVRNLDTVNISSFYDSQNVCIIVPEFLTGLNNTFCQIKVDSPYEVYFSILEHFKIDENKDLVSNKSNESNKIIFARIGENFKHGNFVYIGKDVKIGDNCIFGNNISISGNVQIGNNVTIQSGVIIGEEGYGYYNNFDGFEKRVPHIGGIIIGDNVEIGANSCVVRGGLGDTVISDNVKIDNLCHIAHNVKIGKNTKITAMTMIAGSATIGENCWIAPGCKIMNQIKIGNECFLGMGAVVTKDISKNSLAVGIPAKVIKEYYPLSKGEKK
jgi:UDP-3-O-[3-hydroxymyristoyl] glucosamine N-acyltransferase